MTGNYLFENIAEDHTIKVVISSKFDINIDTDGDGVADKNIDRDNDGKPDLDVPITGDGLVIAIIAFIVILELSAFVTIRVIKRNGYSRLKLK